jgi:hypothetical protein
VLTDISGRPLAKPSTPTVAIRLQLEVILFRSFGVNISLGFRLKKKLWQVE